MASDAALRFVNRTAGIGPLAQGFKDQKPTETLLASQKQARPTFALSCKGTVLRGEPPPSVISRGPRGYSKWRALRGPVDLLGCWGDSRGPTLRDHMGTILISPHVSCLLLLMSSSGPSTNQVHPHPASTGYGLNIKKSTFPK